jgi:hypothetical protein
MVDRRALLLSEYRAVSHRALPMAEHQRRNGTDAGSFVQSIPDLLVRTLAAPHNVNVSTPKNDPLTTN